MFITILRGLRYPKGRKKGHKIFKVFVKMFYFVQSVNLCLIKSCKKLNWSFYHFDDVLVIKCNMGSVIERYCSTFLLTWDLF